MKRFEFALLLTLCAACASAPEPPVEVTTSWELFGEEIATVRPLSLPTVLDRADEYDGRTVLTSGVVEEVCVKKGCWMSLRDGERTMRVTFKDYGFFVPMDIHGREVIVEGVFTLEEVSAEDQRHYLEDAGRPEEAAAITEPEESFLFEATGVRIKPV